MLLWPDAEVLRIIGLVMVAMMLGGIIGVDRELANRPAGLRTHMLVTGSAAVFVAIGEILIRSYDHGIRTDDTVHTDPLRLIEAVITGVSFLGAGTIIQRSRNRQEHGVEGLTIAASLLMSAAIGVAIAITQFWLGIGVAVVSLITLRLLCWLEKWAAFKEILRTTQYHEEEARVPSLHDIMTREVEVLSPNATVAKAATQMARLDVGAIPICDGKRLVECSLNGTWSFVSWLLVVSQR